MNIPQLSISIPTLDEAATLPALLDDLRRQQGVTFEIIVSDGGSRDDTATAAVAAGAFGASLAPVMTWTLACSVAPVFTDRPSARSGSIPSAMGVRIRYAP